MRDEGTSKTTEQLSEHLKIYIIPAEYYNEDFDIALLVTDLA